MTDVSKIKEHMDVFDSSGKKIGQVDHLEGNDNIKLTKTSSPVEGNDNIKLTKTSSPDGQHHFVPVSWVAKIDTHVHLNKAVNDVTALKKAS